MQWLFPPCYPNFVLRFLSRFVSFRTGRDPCFPNRGLPHPGGACKHTSKQGRWMFGNSLRIKQTPISTGREHLFTFKTPRRWSCYGSHLHQQATCTLTGLGLLCLTTFTRGSLGESGYRGSKMRTRCVLPDSLWVLGSDFNGINRRCTSRVPWKGLGRYLSRLVWTTTKVVIHPFVQTWTIFPETFESRNRQFTPPPFSGTVSH